VQQLTVIGQSEDAANFVKETDREGVLNGIELLPNPGDGKPGLLGRVIYVTALP
jgi:hypothetical protein